MRILQTKLWVSLSTGLLSHTFLSLCSIARPCVSLKPPRHRQPNKPLCSVQMQYATMRRLENSSADTAKAAGRIAHCGLSKNTLNQNKKYNITNKTDQQIIQHCVCVHVCLSVCLSWRLTRTHYVTLTLQDICVSYSAIRHWNCPR